MAKISFLTLFLGGLAFLIYLDASNGELRSLNNLFGPMETFSTNAFAPVEDVPESGPVVTFFAWVAELPALAVLAVIFLIFAMMPPENFSFHYWEFSVGGGD
ncbi:hypothetical protein NBRC116588_17300 [Pyruvatibacter sp. HU-CL02332]|uniref:hypothetical protein n=1 Tax=Pyruvatibacter sp. HU-CL02332 TaxID=3127650 RepID=UPI0031090920